MPLYDPSEQVAYGVSLFERLNAPSTQRNTAKGPDPKAVLNSIKHNLERILNTRSGESLGAPDLGLLDFNDAFLSSRDLSTQIQESVTLCIHRYEPRLHNVQVAVTTLQHGFTLHLKVSAYVNHDAIHSQVELDIELNKSKQYIIY